MAPGIQGVFDEIEAATREIIAFARGLDADGLARAILRRQVAVDRVLPALRDARRDGATSRGLDAAVSSMFVLAEEADATLRARREELRDEIGAVANGARTLQGYAQTAGSRGSFEMSR